MLELKRARGTAASKLSVAALVSGGSGSASASDSRHELSSSDLFNTQCMILRAAAHAPSARVWLLGTMRVVETIGSIPSSRSTGGSGVRAGKRLHREHCFDVVAHAWLDAADSAIHRARVAPHAFRESGGDAPSVWVSLVTSLARACRAVCATDSVFANLPRLAAAIARAHPTTQRVLAAADLCMRWHADARASLLSPVSSLLDRRVRNQVEWAKRLEIAGSTDDRLCAVALSHILDALAKLSLPSDTADVGGDVSARPPWMLPMPDSAEYIDAVLQRASFVSASSSYWPHSLSPFFRASQPSVHSSTNALAFPSSTLGSSQTMRSPPPTVNCVSLSPQVADFIAAHL